MAELFHVVHQMLSQYLSVVLEQTATKLPLEIRQYGIRVSSIPDKNILSKCQFVLAIKADVASEELRAKLPSQIKLVLSRIFEISSTTNYTVSPFHR